MSIGEARLKIGILNNNAHVAYGAVGVFLHAIGAELERLGHEVRAINAEPDFRRLSASGDLDATLGIGIYKFAKTGIPLYDLYRVPHFSWIIDNPIKMYMDLISPRVYYIFIDSEFSQVFDALDPCMYTCLPLGAKVDVQPLPCAKEITLFFAGHIKAPNALFQEIKGLAPAQREPVEQVIERSTADLNHSFIRVFREVVGPIPLGPVDPVIKRIFRYANSYTRALRRKLVIQSIRSTEIMIHGVVEDPEIGTRKNVTVMPPIPYARMGQRYARSRLVLNVSPNFGMGCHDRISHALASGACCVTDHNPYLAGLFTDMKSVVFYDFNALESLDDKVAAILEDGADSSIQAEGCRVVLENLSWAALVPQLVTFMLRKVRIWWNR